MSKRNAGVWVFVCGPSGAGKDSLIAAASKLLTGQPGVVFARRLVTRSAGPDAGDDEISRAAFAARMQDGSLIWSWQAHGIGYGIAVEDAGAVADGQVVVVNGSREHAAALTAGPHLKRVLVAAPPALLARRLRERGRESEAEVEARLARNEQLAGWNADLVIDNAGPIAAGANELARFLTGLGGPLRPIVRESGVS